MPPPTALSALAAHTDGKPLYPNTGKDSAGAAWWEIEHQGLVEG